MSAASSTSQSGEDFDDVEEDDGYYQDDYDVDEDDNDDMGFENEARTKEAYVSPDLSAYSIIYYIIVNHSRSFGSADEFFTGDGSPAAVHRLLTGM